MKINRRYETVEIQYCTTNIYTDYLKKNPNILFWELKPGQMSYCKI